MKLCKFGFHDYELISKVADIKKVVEGMLITYGYELLELQTSKGLRVYHKYLSETCHVIIPDNFNIDTTYGNLQNIYYDNHVEVCPDCGKVKYNFTMSDILNQVYKIMERYETQAQREDKVKNILKEKGEYEDVFSKDKM